MVGEESVAHELFLAHISHRVGHTLPQQHHTLPAPERSPPGPAGIIYLISAPDMGTKESLFSVSLMSLPISGHTGFG